MSRLCWVVVALLLGDGFLTSALCFKKPEHAEKG